ncbi:MAG: glycosyltransferase N-terminal domain-containing protein [Candidatus Cloacimonetes bacterium]|jgi:3-deoxy-D-manno-octulosonic-acid transferase|nr:3-deoxy-D-manno-octulosonic acid transferase [Candidatus Cloacimonadota bacterium]MCB5279140.1 3-deoxy-D-manno-octulosonic acid transferase [Candidatus Cloacimonadota bacterium]MDD4231189.1 glycosyltransferase N-terminal domain-containing protein [Candidatus Cloacimonadota bacterium]MDY0298491.1 glycosyltransferase N-terminal domain-containing protein [Candidatus Cloacimonadaceae bacterium]
MKIYYNILLVGYKLVTELIFFISRPILWLILPLFNYRESIIIPESNNDNPVLIHCSSVGELNAIIPLVRHLIKEGIPLIINTVTVTGRDLAKRQFPELRVTLAPLDFASLRFKQIKAISPRLIIVVETEIWPMMLDISARMNVAVIFINARMSDKSLDRYLRMKGLLRYLGRNVQLVLAQSKDDQQRFKKIWNTRVLAAGNLKYCLQLTQYDNLKTREKLGFKKNDKILVWGSSRPGEENLLMTIFPSLKAEIPNLRVILAPRHPKRCDEVERMLIEYEYCKLSELSNGSLYEILLIDGLGYLDKAYAISDLAVVGGSFYNFGGHNPLEPAFYGKAIIIGEYHASCKSSVNKLAQNKALVVSSIRTLQQDIIKLLKNDTMREEMGKRAKIVLTENAEALENHIKGIMKCLP